PALFREGSPDRPRAPETVPLGGEGRVGGRQPAGAQRSHHGLRLPRRDDPIVVPLEEDDRGRDPLRRVQRRAGEVEVAPLRIRPDQPFVISRLELVRLAVQRLEVPDPVVARPPPPDLLEPSPAHRPEPPPPPPAP